MMRASRYYDAAHAADMKELRYQQLLDDCGDEPDIDPEVLDALNFHGEED